MATTAIISTRADDYAMYFGDGVLALQPRGYPTVRDAESAAMLLARAAGAESVVVKRKRLGGYGAVEVGVATASGRMTYTIAPSWSDADDRSSASRSAAMSRSLNRYADGCES